MRRTMLAALLAAGCFHEPPDDKIASSTMPMTTASDESSSSGGESSSEGVEESSSGEAPFDPSVCPEWCSNGNGCEVVTIYMLCMCTSDLECQQGTHCNRPTEDPGHCQ